MKQENVVICITHVISKSFSTWTSDNQESTTLSNTLKSYPWELFSEIKESGGYGTVFRAKRSRRRGKYSYVVALKTIEYSKEKANGFLSEVT